MGGVITNVSDLKCFCRSIGIKELIRVYDEAGEIAVLVAFSFRNLLLVRKLRKQLLVRIPINVMLTVGLYLKHH